MLVWEQIPDKPLEIKINTIHLVEAHSEQRKTSEMELFAKIVNIKAASQIFDWVVSTLLYYVSYISIAIYTVCVKIFNKTDRNMISHGVFDWKALRSIHRELICL